MKVVEIRDVEALNGLRSAWTGLLEGSSSNRIFLTWEWATAWWSAYGKPGELRVLAVYDDGDVLRGIAPMRSVQVQRCGQTVHALQFIGDAPSYADSDYLDFIIAPDYQQSVMEVLHQHWAAQLQQGTVLLLDEIPETSPNLAAVKESARSRGMILTETEVPCATVQLPDTWDGYLGLLKSRFRTKVRSTLRNLEARTDVEFGFCRNPQDLERLLPILFDLHARRWQQEGQQGVFNSPGKREFYRTLSLLLLDRGWLRFSWLAWRGQVLACQFGFAYDGVYSQLQEGYEPASEHWNIGVGLRAWSIREFVKQGLREYDFLGGVNRHKTDWGAEVKRSQRLLLASRNHKNALFIQGPEWTSGAREAIRGMVPDRLLTVYRQHMQPREAGDPGSVWVRQAAAKCYVHSGVPALIRPLRDRFQITLQPNGGMPKASWQRRSQGSARIFCYHRVNDANDPFVPATSTELFEAHLRYLSRNYKVVAMNELQNHLVDGDSVEPVIALTFDDGYRDNFENAFPLLRRYNLPATIFLTTGVIDSGEALWFERLAVAIKNTTQESIDLEIDVPRRFWLRTQAERLESDGKLVGILRLLADAERRTWLQEILRQLGAGKECEREGQMLTWDQIRVMNRHGVDFGGHTVTHPFLSKLPVEQAHWEAAECKRRIEEELQTPAHYFAYPNGGGEDFTATNKELLRSIGYRAAVTTIWGLNYRSTDPMELKRSGPWEHDPALFAMKLDWYQWMNQ